MTAPVLLRFLTLASCMKGRSWASTPQIRTGKRTVTRDLRRRSIRSPCRFEVLRSSNLFRLDGRMVGAGNEEENLPGSCQGGAPGHIVNSCLHIRIDGTNGSRF